MMWLVAGSLPALRSKRITLVDTALLVATPSSRAPLRPSPDRRARRNPPEPRPWTVPCGPEQVVRVATRPAAATARPSGSKPVLARRLFVLGPHVGVAGAIARPNRVSSAPAKTRISFAA